MKSIETESDVQGRIIDLCAYLGLRVLKTSRVRKRCLHCGRYSSVGDGVTKGLPDLFVQPKNNTWEALWLGVEIKGKKTALSAEQAALAEKKAIIIVRDEKEFYEQIKRYNEVLRL